MLEIVGAGFGAAKAANTQRRDTLNYGCVKSGVVRGVPIMASVGN